MTSNPARTTTSAELPSSDNPNQLASRLQSRAANPNNSAWVEASAGSGKTKVLIDRVLRLLLAGVAPHRILCLTFTKAAAAEMAVRLTRELGKWATLPHERLAATLEALTGALPNDDQMQQARRLFAATLDAPGGLQLQTIHSFCQSLLARFPLEAGVPVGFKVIEGRACEELLEKARRQALADASAQPQGELAQAVNTLLEVFGDDFADIERSIIGNSLRLERILAHGPGLALAQLDTLLELAPGESVDSLVRAFCSDDAHDMPALREAARSLIDDGTKTNVEQGNALAAWLEKDVEGRVMLFSAFNLVFLTKDGEMRKNICTAKLAQKQPALHTTLQDVAERLLMLQEKQRALHTARTSRALIVYAADIIQRYNRFKAAMTALDFDDLINAAARLVTADMSPWVLYKLDGGIAHVLVDEAQDTNERQWQLAHALTTDFFSGTGRQEYDPPRSVFAVGDYKQSIYSFQGANPDAFRVARDEFAKRIAATGSELQVISFNISFRSTSAVLNAVDRVFLQSEAGNGLPDYLEHSSSQPQLPGVVEVWPVAPPDDAESDTRTLPLAKLATVLAAQIRAWVEGKHMLPARGRPMEYGDFMVLVRQRGTFMPEFVRACKKLMVPIAGADRLYIDNQLAVQDLLAFASFLLLPEDDLTLATVLKGPFIGMSEDELFELAYNRKGASLLSRLGQHGTGRAYAEWLASWQRRTDRITPYTLLSSLLAEPCPRDERSGRRAIVGRLGPEANDPLDELLTLALEYEQGEVPSLQGFLRWIQQGKTEIKRQMDQAGGMVRIMTIHGSKGLQAPVVIVADSIRPASDKNRLLLDPHGRQPPLLAPKRELEAVAARARREALHKANRDESNRLLYVALTRAEDQLIFAPWSQNNTKMDSDGALAGKQTTPGWYHHLFQGLGSADNVTFDFTSVHPLGWSGPGLRLQLGEDGQSRPAPPKAATLPSRAISLPGWATRLPPQEPSPTRPLTPSKVEDDGPVVSPLESEDGWRYRRGKLVHRLLQTLPDLPPEQRRQAGLAWLGRQATNPHKLMDEVLAVINHPDYAVLFGANSRAEVPVSGMVGSRVLSGQIDRLAVTNETVWLVDYKTNRERPANSDSVDPIYLKQLAAYRAALLPLYPGRRIRAILLWTDGPELMEIPDNTLDSYAP